MWFLNIYLRGTHIHVGANWVHNFWDKIVSQRLRKMLFAKKQFVRFKYARELFSFSWIGMWLAFLSTVGSPWKSFLYRIDNLKPISSPSFQGEKFIHVAKKTDPFAYHLSIHCKICFFKLKLTSYSIHKSSDTYVGEFTKIFAGTY